MLRCALISALLIALPQEPARDQDPKESKPIEWWARDTKTGEVYLTFNGYGHLDQASGTAILTRIWVKYDTKATQDQQAHTINVYANRCTVEGLKGDDANQQFVMKFSGGLRVHMDDDVRLWTSEGTLEANSKILKCPGPTHLVHFTWPPAMDLASALVFMDPVELGWLRLLGAPEPDLEVVGEDFVFDAASSIFTSSRNGRIRVKGSLAEEIKPDRRPKPGARQEPTELRCDGPLRLRRLGSPDAETWPTLHVTAEKNVIIEHRTKDALTRTNSDTASFYLAIPPKNVKANPRPLSAVIAGRVRIHVDGMLTAAGDLVEWSHQDSLMRMTGVPRVEVVQGNQKLYAREVVVDRSNGTIDFIGEIEAAFLATEGAKDLMTLVPGTLRVLTDPRGRPTAIQARNGVRLTGGGSGADAVRAHGTAFDWDLIAGDGLLRGAPFARIQQGFRVVIAPLISLSGDTIDQSLMTVKGPKIMRFFDELAPPRNPGRDALEAALGLPGLASRPAEPTLNSSASALEAALGLPGLQMIPDRRNSVMDFTVTCEGDVQVDQKAGLVKLVDRCVVRAQDSTLTADRLFVFLKEASPNSGRRTAFDRVTGSGHVVAVYTEGPKGGPMRVEGETFELRLDPEQGSKGKRIVTIVGHPEGRLLYAGRDARFQRMRIKLDKDKTTMSMDRGSLPLVF